jgi:gluconolactonase
MKYCCVRIRTVSVIGYLSMIVLLIACSNSVKNNMASLPLTHQDSTNAIFDTTEKLQLISNQFAFTEGPATDKKGDVYFTDQPNNTIWKYSTKGKLSLYMDSAGRSNGMYFDQAGNLVSCADGNNELWSIAPDKKVKVLLDNFENKKLNGPNDVWVDRTTGGMYFTDPYYQRDYWKRKAPEVAGMKVYYLPAGAKEAVAVTDLLKKPNGITGTADGKYLYVADIDGNKTYRFERAANGALINSKVFVNQGSDGMTIDSKGNIYLTGKGVTVYGSTGNKIAHIDVPESWTANICFSGKNKDYIFITASKSVYLLKTKSKGIE